MRATSLEHEGLTVVDIVVDMVVNQGIALSGWADVSRCVLNSVSMIVSRADFDGSLRVGGAPGPAHFK